MKNIYIKPQSKTVRLQGPMLLLDGSHEVDDYKQGKDIFAGDTDD